MPREPEERYQVSDADQIPRNATSEDCAAIAEIYGLTSRVAGAARRASEISAEIMRRHDDVETLGDLLQHDIITQDVAHALSALRGAGSAVAGQPFAPAAKNLNLWARQ